MTNIFITSDTHIGHVGVTKFLDKNGNKIRPYDTVEEMDEALIANWNSVVKPKDKIYHLGDVVINRKALATLARLNGDKVLIKGNHDIFKLNEYTPYFRDIRGFGHLDGFALSHIPIHPQELGRWKGCWHGHLHTNVVMRDIAYPPTVEGGEIVWESITDNRYMCLCVEQTNFTPISLEDAKIRWEAQQ